jgi:N-acetylglutamate synthase-like GNAT family acetyltransferase
MLTTRQDSSCGVLLYEGIFTFDKKEVFLDKKCVKIDGNDNLIPYLENDINSMLKKNTHGIELDMKDFSSVMKKSSKVTYVCYGVCTHKNRQVMLDEVNSILDKIDVVVGKISANYLVYIEMEYNFDFDIAKIFMASLYDVSSDDSIVIMGFNEAKKLKLSKKKKNYMNDEEKKVPCVTFKIIIGVD